ncbi:MAG: HupE/UreJ family protein [Bacteroidota bacterium]
MSKFQLFLEMGFQHISDPQAYDHIVFLIALCAGYPVTQWKNILVLVTAFTLGHSITLALATLDIIPINSDLVEFLIPITILITAITNFINRNKVFSKVQMYRNYAIALFFGLIHGMGFSNYLRSLLGKEENIITPLLSFNLGLEIGQLMIVAIIYVISYAVIKGLGAPHRDWNVFVSGAAAGIAIILIQSSIFW